jgi:hypothetical protein
MVVLVAWMIVTIPMIWVCTHDVCGIEVGF